MNKKNVFSILLILVVLVVYFYNEEDDMQSPSANLASQPVYQSDHMMSRIYDVDGYLTYKIESAKTKYFDESNKMEFELPNVMLFDKKHSPSWYIQSKKAVLTNDKQLYLYRDVQLDNLIEDSQLQQITTDNAIANLNTQIVTSEDPVEIQGTGLNSTGVGLFVDLKAKTANILNAVKTHYRIEK